MGEEGTLREFSGMEEGLEVIWRLTASGGGMRTCRLDPTWYGLTLCTFAWSKVCIRFPKFVIMLMLMQGLRAELAARLIVSTATMLS